MAKTNRRQALKNIVLGAGAMGLGTAFPVLANPLQQQFRSSKSRINQSVCRWTFGDMPLAELAIACSKIGIKAIDLLTPEEWPVAEKHGLECSMGTAAFASIEHGFNERDNHKKLQQNYRELIDKASAQGVKNIICFSGNRNGKSAETGIENCALGLEPLLDYAADKDVTLVMELLNSEVDHPDYQADHTEWGVALAQKMDRDNFKLLYDIYHMQIMEGNIIATIEKYHPYINHYHTAGVPGRHEINNTQELNYPAIMRAIAATGFDGYVAQEFIPTYPDELAALREAVRICDV